MAIPPVPGFDHLWTFSAPSPEETRRSLALQPFAFLLQPFPQPASNPGISALNPGISALNPGISALNPGISALNPAGALSPVRARKVLNRRFLDLRALA